MVRTVDPETLAAELLSGDRPALVDVRPAADAAGWTLDGDGVTTVNVPAAGVLDPPHAAADQVPAGSVLVCTRGRMATAVAHALPEKDLRVLDGGLRAWIGLLLPHRVDVGVDSLTVLQVQRPGRGCLSYVLVADGEALVVDPAPHPDAYVALAAEHGARIVGVLDTHLHADHLSGARALAAAADARHVVPAATVDRGVAFTPDATVTDGATLALGAHDLRVVALPGHTTDMTGLLVGDRAILSGDSLFADGIARPDLEVGDLERSRAMARTLHATLRHQVLSLPGDAILLGGHAHPGLRAGAVAPTLDEVRAAVPELALQDPEAFADELLRAMPPRPANYEAVIEANAGRTDPDPELESGGNSCSSR